MVQRASLEKSGLAEVSAEFERLRRFSGAPAEFWSAYVAAMCRLTGAAAGEIQVRQGADAPWKTVARHPTGASIGALPDELREQALAEGSAVDGAAKMLAVDLSSPGTPVVIVGWFRPEAGQSPDEAAVRAAWGRDVPAAYTTRRRLERAEETVGSFASVLDLLRVMDTRHRYLEAAMTLCNEAAARFRCERVSLGWMVGGHMKLQAMSHSEKFEKKMAAVQALEALMEEAVDQDEEVGFPEIEGSDAIARLHERFAAEQGSGHLVSLPLRKGEEPVAAITLERSGSPFEPGELRSLRMLGDQVATRLGELRRHDRWFGARWWGSLRENAAKLVGVENTGWKLLGLVGAVALAVLIFGGSMYRVEAPFILKSDTQTQVPAAFDGYIQAVHFHVGDAVEEGATLLDIDRRELMLEESAAMAELRRHRSDARKAEAEGDLSVMRGAMARAVQAEASLEMIRYRLSQTEIIAPFDGVIVEGDLRERVGSPVKQGEVLLKLARLEPLYVEGKIDETNVHLIEEGKAGEIAFASRPDLKFPIHVERIEPLALPEEGGNVFVVRCRVEGAPPDWWRPGMSGLCKIETERRSFLWILTRKTVDFLRMKLWW